MEYEKVSLLIPLDLYNKAKELVEKGEYTGLSEFVVMCMRNELEKK